MTGQPPPGPERERLGKRISQAMRVAGLSQGDLARATGVAPSAISRICEGKRPASPHLLSQIAAATGVPLETLRGHGQIAAAGPPGYTPGQCPARYAVFRQTGGTYSEFTLTCDIRPGRAAAHPGPHHDPSGPMWEAADDYAARLAAAAVTIAGLGPPQQAIAVLQALSGHRP